MGVAKKSGVKLPGRRLAEAGWAAGRVEEVGAHGRALCRWCRMEVLAKRRRTFCSDYCVHQWKLRSDPGYLREQVFLRDKGVCVLCGTDTVAAYAELKQSRGKARAEALEVWGMRSVAARKTLWDADHVLPVAEGGGECDLENLRTLCLCCHREVTADLRRRMKRQEVGSRKWEVQKTKGAGKGNRGSPLCCALVERMGSGSRAKEVRNVWVGRWGEGFVNLMGVGGA